jgi:hypothetical protein
MFNLLKGRFEVILVNVRRNERFPGPKTNLKNPALMSISPGTNVAPIVQLK